MLVLAIWHKHYRPVLKSARAFEWLNDLQRARVGSVLLGAPVRRHDVLWHDRACECETPSELLTLQRVMQAEASRGERSKVTIADVIERANGEIRPRCGSFFASMTILLLIDRMLLRQG